jgi:hypothetical protein
LFIFKREIENVFLAEIGKSNRKTIKPGEWIEGDKPGLRDRRVYRLDGEFSP